MRKLILLTFIFILLLQLTNSIELETNIDREYQIYLEDNYRIVDSKISFYPSENLMLNLNYNFPSENIIEEKVSFNGILLSPVHTDHGFSIPNLNLSKERGNILEVEYRIIDDNIKFCKLNILFPFCSEFIFNKPEPFVQVYLGQDNQNKVDDVIIKYKNRKIIFKALVSDRFKIKPESNYYTTEHSFGIVYKNGSKIIEPKLGDSVMGQVKFERVALKYITKFDNSYEVTYPDKAFAPGLILFIAPDPWYQVLFFLPMIMIILMLVFRNKLQGLITKIDYYITINLKFKEKVFLETYLLAIIVYLTFYFVLDGKWKSVTLIDPIVYIPLLAIFTFVLWLICSMFKK